MAAETAAPVTTTPAAVTEPAAPEEEPAPTEVPDAEPETADDSEPVFVYLQEGGDFNSETAVYYQIHLADYIQDRSKLYDIKVTVQASNAANGGLGIIVDGEWVVAHEKLRDTSAQVWELDGIDPRAATSDAVVQLYYLKDNAEFKVLGVEVTEANSTSADAAPEPEEITEPEAEEPAPENDGQADETEEEIAAPEAAPAEAPKADAAAEEDDEEEGGETENNGSSNDAEAEDDADADDTQAEEAAETTEDKGTAAENNAESGEADAGIGEEQQAEQPESAAEIEDTVIHASQEADRNSGSNPGTGSSRSPILTIIMVLCGLEILWSLFVIVYNRTVGKKD